MSYVLENAERCFLKVFGVLMQYSWRTFKDGDELNLNEFALISINLEANWRKIEILNEFLKLMNVKIWWI